MYNNFQYFFVNKQRSPNTDNASKKEMETVNWKLTKKSLSTHVVADASMLSALSVVVARINAQGKEPVRQSNCFFYIMLVSARGKSCSEEFQKPLKKVTKSRVFFPSDIPLGLCLCLQYIKYFRLLSFFMCFMSIALSFFFITLLRWLVK